MKWSEDCGDVAQAIKSEILSGSNYSWLRRIFDIKMHKLKRSSDKRDKVSMILGRLKENRELQSI